MTDYWKTTSERIAPGKEYMMYFIYCTACKVYKRLQASPPAGPGGTLSCPYCRENNQNGPYIEGSYGIIKTKGFVITLPEDVVIDEHR